MSNNERQINKDRKEAQKPISALASVVPTCAGSHIAPVYKRVYDDELKRDLVKEVDKTDLYEFIQASKAQTDMAMLQKRFIELGEIPAADPSLKFGVDTSNLPSDIHGVYNMVNDVDANFKMLPESIQALFGDSQAYLKSILDGSYQATLLNAINKKNEPEEDKKGDQ